MNNENGYPPILVEILIHYWVSSDDFPRLDAPAVVENIAFLVGRGILIKSRDSDDEPQYIPNRDALKVYIDAICCVPLPEQKWVLPENSE